jgi:hypothetical protein
MPLRSLTVDSRMIDSSEDVVELIDCRSDARVPTALLYSPAKVAPLRQEIVLRLNATDGFRVDQSNLIFNKQHRPEQGSDRLCLHAATAAGLFIDTSVAQRR